MWSLFIYSCAVAGKTLVDIILRWYYLEILSVNDCHDLMSARLLQQKCDIQQPSKTLKTLRELSLESNRYLLDALFNRSVTIVPNLEDLSLTDCWIIFDTRMWKIFYPGNMSKSDNIMASEQTNSMVWVRERTIPTERPPLLGEVVANFCG
jgi:hypothetical protein